ncbi:MAG: hypothetical protein V1735_04250 [Nanoarchaeota archaeon]
MQTDFCGIGNQHLDALLRMIEGFENSPVADPLWSYNVEFGLNPLFFFQGRPCKMKRKPEDFLIPESSRKIIPEILIGISSEEGIRLRLALADLNHPSVSLPRDEPYALMTVSKQYHSIDCRIALGDLKVALPKCDFVNFLDHWTYRLIKRADITFIDYAEIPKQGFLGVEYVRIFSNGRQGILMPD